MDRKLYRSLIWRGFILLALVLSACTTPTTVPTDTRTPVPTDTPTTVPTDTPTPVPTDTPTTVPTDTPTTVPVGELTPIQIEPGGLDMVCSQNKALLEVKLETTPFFVKDQVILTGPPQAVSDTVNELSDQGIALETILECAVTLPEQIEPYYDQGKPFEKSPSGDPSEPSSPYYQPNPPGFVTQEANRLTTNLYAVIPPADPVEVFQVFNDLKASNPELAEVYLDPNYLVGQQATSQCSDPFGPQGRPFGVEGSPFGVEGSPYGGMAFPAMPAAYGDQWAFKRIGVNPPGPNPQPTSEGVLVGVFDTSPFHLAEGEIMITATEPVTTPLINLTVHHPFQLPGLAVSSTVTTPTVVVDHGLFVSSLIYAVDPQSEIHLYRVLDEMGCGTLYHLNIAMLNFISDTWNKNTKKLKQPAVINLSLGIQRPRDLTAETDPATYLAQFGNFGDAIIAAYQLVALDPSIESLKTVVHLAFRAGMVVVAAAGNDSVNQSPPLPSMPLGMQMPAWYSFVIGVSATNPKDEGSCYSNQGDVAAPGGEAEPGTQDGSPVCLPKTLECLVTPPAGVLPGDCQYGLVGLSRTSPSSYAYWVGTSFATPLVAGLAALDYRNNRNNPAQVYRSIQTQVDRIPGWQFGTGIVHVP